MESTEFVVKRGKNHINAYGKTKIDQLTVEMLNIEVLENLHWHLYDFRKTEAMYVLSVLKDTINIF